MSYYKKTARKTGRREAIFQTLFLSVFPSSRLIMICTLLFAGSFCFSSCSNSKAESTVHAGQAIQVDQLPGSCPYLTQDAKGNLVMSWVRMINDSVSAFCYVVSADHGQSFSQPVVIPATNKIEPHSENLPKVIFKPSGEIIALWGEPNPNPKNKYSGLVFYSQSFDNGITWNSPRPLVNDTSGYDQRYYDVALLPGGEVAIIWLDNRKATGKEGSALYFAVTKGKDGFSGERRISEGCCQCCRTALFIDSKSGIHILYRGIIKDSIRDMLHSVSNDGGNSFSPPRIINNDNWVIRGCPHTGPAMTENKEGLHFTWFTGAINKGCFYTRSDMNGEYFTGYERISEMGSHPQIAAFTDGRLAIAWDETVEVNNNYYKRIAVQLRSAKGSGGHPKFITSDTSTATYPVIKTLDDANCFIAYTKKTGDKNYVMYQRVKVK
jgi:hypothetical protein